MLSEGLDRLEFALWSIGKEIVSWKLTFLPTAAVCHVLHTNTPPARLLVDALGACLVGHIMVFVAFACVFACLAVPSAFLFSPAGTHWHDCYNDTLCSSGRGHLAGYGATRFWHLLHLAVYITNRFWTREPHHRT